MAHRHLGHCHEAKNVHGHRIDIQLPVQGVIVMPCTGTDNDQVNTAELLEHVLEGRRSITLRHVEAAHDRFGRECFTKGLESIKPAGQEPQAPTGTIQFVGERLADAGRRTDDDRRARCMRVHGDPQWCAR